MSQVTVAQLKAMETLKDVPESQLQWLISAGTVHTLSAGDVLLEMGAPLNITQFIVEGKLRIGIKQGSQFKEAGIAERGKVLGYLPYSRGTEAGVQVECITDCLVLEVPGDEIRGATRTHFELTEALVHTMTSRVRSFTTQQQQIEKMVALGKLSAGLAHELNNPAASIVRNAAFLTKYFNEKPALFEQVASLNFEPQQLKQLQQKLQIIFTRPEQPALGMMEKAQLEDDLNDLLADKNINDYCLAESFAEEGLQLAEVEEISALVPAESLAAVLGWINNQLSINKMVKDIKEASERISNLVSAVKGFSHMDQGADKQFVDVHKGLENTLTIMDYKLKKSGVEVVKSFDMELPQIKAVPGELNQVWTNIIDNAVDAIDGKRGGKLEIITEYDARNVYITIRDNGPGIPEDIQSRIFDPFFTTKEMGKGTGLGLDVVKRIVSQHQGTVKLKSVPGNTSFQICFPVNGK
ncbi:GHKL domain-containing protein [Mucilaginibacter sp. Bleaf8]|uniref:ATP-binding protein n=1 Tax=Mucilaginibacter sp. Bleaf8 TaxID=2834430 RepID=UPI001BCCAD67|nr:ATP-binding protein [Mucilaginibacter sp. Bleaf8]MBS7565952.1 GHKL domain-containing protein [Mucilaginibacter sp. Bleaf8]